MELKPKQSEQAPDPKEEYLRSLLHEGEVLDAYTMACWQKHYVISTFVAVGVTDRRLIIQQTDRRGRPNGDAPVSLGYDDLAKASIGKVSGGIGLDSSILNSSGFTVRLKDKTGKKYRLNFASGGGPFGGFSDSTQVKCAEAVVEFVDRFNDN